MQRSSVPPGDHWPGGHAVHVLPAVIRYSPGLQLLAVVDVTVIVVVDIVVVVVVVVVMVDVVAVVVVVDCPHSFGGPSS